MTLYGAGQEPQIKWVAFITILMFGLAVFFALFLSAMEEPLENIVGMSAIFVVAGLICGAYTLRASRSMSAAKGLLSGGVAGTARVLGLQQTGRYMNEQPHVQMELAVETKEHGSYTTTHAEYVPMVMLGTLTNGRPIGVRVDASDRTKLVIDWDATMAGGLSGGDPSAGGAGAGGLSWRRPRRGRPRTSATRCGRGSSPWAWTRRRRSSPPPRPGRRTRRAGPCSTSRSSSRCPVASRSRGRRGSASRSSGSGESSRARRCR